jgi:tetratricopeptide (TPR) repeat protein
MGKDKLAKAKAKKAIQLDPENSDYYRIASSVHQKKYVWNKTDSIKYLKKALELSPNDIDLLVSIADYYYYQEGNLSKAEEYLKSALAIDPTDNEALITMGHILYKQGKRHEARELAMIAVSNTPDYIEALRLLCLSTIPRYSLTGMSYRTRIWLAKPGRWPVIILLIFSRLGIFFYLFMLFSGSLLEKKVKRKYMKEINLKKGF